MASHVVGYPHIGDLEKVAADLSKSNDHFIDAEWVPDVKLPYAFYKAGREYMEAKASRKSSPGVTYEAVQKAAAALKGSDHRRATNVSARLDAQQKKLNFHLLPTSIIGSFPQTMELRKVRREYKAKKISEDDYVKAIEEEIREFVEFQEELGINVLVHGEPERNDMVEYFGKSSPRGQRCGGPKLFLIKETKGDRDEIDYTEDDLWHCLPEELKEYFGKSPPAISRSPIPKTMKVKIMVNSHEYIALIDTGSNHNFLQPWVAEEAGLEIIEEKPIEVCIADGSIMCSEGSCPEFKFVIQGCQFATQAYILQMGGCDVILGVEWLRGLGKIYWDFASLKMELTQGGKTIQIKGMDTEDIHSPRVPSTEEIADGINKMLAVLETIQVHPDGGLKNKILRSQLVSAK